MSTNGWSQEGHLIKWKKIEKLLKYFEETPFCSFGGSWL
jgi:hypothetical protein